MSANEPQDVEQARVPCPDCPDGSVWTSKGPTDDICPTCKGEAFVWVDAAIAGERHE